MFGILIVNWDVLQIRTAASKEHGNQELGPFRSEGLVIPPDKPSKPAKLLTENKANPEQVIEKGDAKYQLLPQDQLQHQRLQLNHSTFSYLFS